MAADRQRLAAALAYEEERRRRMMESVPVVDGSTPTTEPRRSLRSDLENLSSGLGQAGVNILEGGKALLTDPIGTVKGTYETVKGVVRDPSLIADALRYTADKAMSGPLGAGEVIGEMVNPVRFRRTPVMQEIDVYHGSPHRFEEFDARKIGTGQKQANVAESEMSSLVDLFNRQAKREVDFTNQRLERTSGAGEYITFSPAQSLSDIDNDVSYAGLLSKANLLEQIGKDQGFTTKVEGSSKSGSQYVKFYKELADGEIDFKIRISDHSDVSRFSPTYEKKALDLNPDSMESIADAIDFLKDQNKVKKFYEEF